MHFTYWGTTPFTVIVTTCASSLVGDACFPSTTDYYWDSTICICINTQRLSVFCVYIDMGVSKNRGTPKSSILIGFSMINHPFWGTPIFGNIHIYLDPPFGVPNGWGRVPLSNPLRASGFKHYLLEGTGRYTMYLKCSQQGKVHQFSLIT